MVCWTYPTGLWRGLWALPYGASTVVCWPYPTGLWSGLLALPYGLFGAIGTDSHFGATLSHLHEECTLKAGEARDAPLTLAWKSLVGVTLTVHQVEGGGFIGRSSTRSYLPW